MKMITHRQPIGDALPFDLGDLKLFLRVDHDEEDTIILNAGLAAALELEEFAEIALLRQTIRVTVFDPKPSGSGLRLPIGPAVPDRMPDVTADGEPFTGFCFENGSRAFLRWQHDSYATRMPTRLTVEYEAGFGSNASDIPADLRQAIMDQAALHYDGRAALDAKQPTASPHLARIGARYRGVRA